MFLDVIFSRKFINTSLYFNNRKYQTDQMFSELYKLNLEETTDVAISLKKKEVMEQQKSDKRGLEAYLNQAPLEYHSLLYFSKFCYGNINGLEKRSNINEKEIVEVPKEKVELVQSYKKMIADNLPEDIFYSVSNNQIAVSYTYITKEEKKLQIRQIERNDILKKFMRRDITDVRI